MGNPEDGFTLRSAAFPEKGAIPSKYTCDSEDLIPPLQFEGIPGNAASLALIVDDPDAPGGLWDQLGGVGKAGEGVIIGIIDSGIWPEHPSFSDRTGSNGNGTKDGKLGYQQIPGWNGKCTPGEAFAASHCSQKLIGAKSNAAAR